MTYAEIRERVKGMDFKQIERETGVSVRAFEHLCSDSKDLFFPWIFEKVASGIALLLEVPTEVIMASYYADMVIPVYEQRYGGYVYLAQRRDGITKIGHSLMRSRRISRFSLSTCFTSAFRSITSARNCLGCPRVRLKRYGKCLICA
jgi:hypothetical protein